MGLVNLLAQIIHTLVIFNLVKPMVEENQYFLMGIFILENLNKIRKMGMGKNKNLMVVFLKEIGKMGSKYYIF